MSNVALRAAGLTKRYGSVRALDGLDLEVGVGEVHAFFGPNGAGKTTTIRILLGLLRKDGGEVSLLGADPWRDAVELHRRLAYVPGDVTLWPNLTGGEIIDLLGRLRGVHELAVTGTVVRCQVDDAALDEVVGRLHRAGIRSLTCRPPTLEELFLRHYSPERSPAGNQR